MNIGLPEILLILLVVLLLFGAKRLPDVARSLGRSMRILKSETRAMSEDEDTGAAAKEEPQGATPEALGTSPAADTAGPQQQSPASQPTAGPAAAPMEATEPTSPEPAAPATPAATPTAAATEQAAPSPGASPAAAPAPGSPPAPEPHRGEAR